MKKALAAIGKIALAVAMAGAAAAVFIRLYPTLYTFETTSVARDAEKISAAAERLDRRLLGHLGLFRRVTSFDHVLAGGARQFRAPDLWVDRCEVRQGDFYKFTNWAKRSDTQAAGLAAPGQSSLWRYFSVNREHKISGQLTAPANGVTFYDAYAYCRAAGGRLPYGDEWTAAATGAAGRLYPWGDDFDSAPWPYLDPLLNAAQKCGRHPRTDTPAGLHDMGGVVSEWAQNRDDPLRPTVHGANAFNKPFEIYALNILHRRAPPNYRSAYVGFRCVYDRPPPKPPWGGAAPQTAKLLGGLRSTGTPPDARVPELLVNLPRERLDLVARIFDGDGQDAARDFRIMRSEVTRRQYALFLNDPLARLGLYADEQEPLTHDYRPRDWEEQQKRPELPVTGVDWWSARAFASWAGGRLPTGSEWTRAASSQGRSIYPWGQAFAPANTVSMEAGLNQPQPPGSRPADTTRQGVKDMGGNVSEWTQSADLTGGRYALIVKGGNYMLPGEETARIDFSNRAPPNYRSPTLGFRVVFGE